MMKTSIVTVWLFLVAGVLCAAPAAQPKTPSGDKQPKAAAKPAPRPQAPAKAEPKAFSRAEGEVFESPAAVTPVNEIDRLVLPRLAALKIKPVLCSDAVFIRRTYIDVIGALPTAQEARAFIQDKDRNKRAKLIDRLLERDEFADYWSMKWGDVLRIKAEFPVNLWPNAAQAYHRWLRASIRDNKPYDHFARELLTSSGSNFRVGPVNFYRAIQNRTPDGVAAAVALALMGSRIDKWPKDRAEGLAPFFSQIGYKPTREWKEENVFWDPYGTHPPSTGTGAAAPEGSENKKLTTLPARLKPLAAVLPDGTKVKLQPTRDPREVFADWLITPANPWFTRAIANRVWAWLLGRGIIHEPDDIRPDNPPANPELLAYLEKEMIAGKYDMRRLYRQILTSATYQLAPAKGLADAKAEANFAAYPLQRLDAEVLIDAVNQITGTTDLYTSPIPEPFTYIPNDMPAVAIADGSITSPFLALFGRSARATGMWNERDNRHMPAQWLHMLNSSHIQRKLESSSTLKALFESKKPAREIIEELYLTVLSRFPTPGEMARAEAYSTVKGAKPGAPKRREDWIDITWALINSIEFLYRH